MVVPNDSPCEPGTADLVYDYVRILRQFGPDSPQASAFALQYQHREEFAELATVAHTLKRAFAEAGRKGSR